jgi:hypothetical protein
VGVPTQLVLLERANLNHWTMIVSQVKLYML